MIFYVYKISGPGGRVWQTRKKCLILKIFSNQNETKDEKNIYNAETQNYNEYKEDSNEEIFTEKNENYDQTFI